MDEQRYLPEELIFDNYAVDDMPNGTENIVITISSSGCRIDT